MARPRWWGRIVEQVAAHALRVASAAALERLARAFLARTGEPLSIARAARAAGAPLETARRQLQGLEAGLLLEEVKAHGRSQVRSPLLLPLDSALVEAEGPDGERALRVLALLALARAASPEAELGHWATHAGARIDLVAATRAGTIGVALRARLPASAQALRGLRSFLASVPGARVLVLAPDARAAAVLADRIVAAPIGLLVPAPRTQRPAGRTGIGGGRRRRGGGRRGPRAGAAADRAPLTRPPLPGRASGEPRLGRSGGRAPGEARRPEEAVEEG